MTKQDSQTIKGVAILFMIFLHLFNRMSNVDLCHNLIYIEDLPLANILTRATDPVSLFLIVGGYGLYTVWKKGDRNHWTRLIKLYLHWILIMTIFVIIGHFINPDTYPGSPLKFIMNGLGIYCNYNGEIWFLLPYVILSALSPWLFRLMDRFNAILVIGVTLIIHLCTSWLIGRYGAAYLYSHVFVYDLLLPFHLLFSFSLGAMCARCDFFRKVKNFLPARISKPIYINTIAIALIILITIVKCSFRYNFLYSFLFITLFLLIKLPPFIRTALVKFGDNSMNMWMIHSWFCYYLFHNFIYSFSYPIVIFAVLTAISYICSLIINYIAAPIERLFMTRKQVEEKPML